MVLWQVGSIPTHSTTYLTMYYKDIESDAEAKREHDKRQKSNASDRLRKLAENRKRKPA